MNTSIAQLRTTFNRRTCLWLLIFCVVAPFAYADIQGYWASLMPDLKPYGIHSRETVFFAIALFSIPGVMLTAAVLVCPLVILARTQSVILGVTFGLITVATLLVIAHINEYAEWIKWLSVIEYLAFVLFCVLASYLTERAMERARA
jgi:hypothetical protein